MLLIAGNALAADGWIVGVGGEGDTADGLAGTVFADVAVAEKTWLTGSIARNFIDRSPLPSIDTWNGSLGLDHWFEPVGVRLAAAYWGDSDTLDSRDWRGSVYWRSKRVTLGGDFEYRDFSFTLPATDVFPGRIVQFDATGVGLSTRFDVSESASLSLAGMKYDYSINLRLGDNRRLIELLSFSRLSLINSLVDHTAMAALGLDVGDRRWQLEAGTWQSAVDGSRSRSVTVRFLTPVGKRRDVELGLGVDESDIYGSVTFFSVFFYFYGD